MIFVSFILGGPIGIGTLYVMVVMGIAMKIVFRLFKFEPRDIEHESIIKTLEELVIG